MRRKGSDLQPEAGPDPRDELLVPDEEYAVDRFRARVSQRFGDRPFTVYLVLFAGAATLLLLLAVVWISATGDSERENLFCTYISPQDARAAVLAGQIERVHILVNNEQPTETLTGIELRYNDQTCRQTAQGAEIREQLFSIIGAVGLFNNFSDTTIDVRYQEQEIQPELLVTASPTVPPTETPTVAAPTVVASPSEPTATEVPPTATSEPTAPQAATPSSETGTEEAPVGNPGA